jgi:hypothetical protein
MAKILRTGKRTRPKTAIKLRERLFERHLAGHIAPLGAAIAADLVSENVGENLTQPGGQLGLGLAAEVPQIPAYFRQGLLNDMSGGKTDPK